MRLLVYSLFHPMISLRCNLSLLSRFCKDTEVCPRKDTERHTWVQGLTVMRHFAQEVSTAKKRRKSWKPFLNKGGPNSNNFKGEGTFGVCLLLCWYSFENTSGICKNFKFPVVLAVNWFRVEKMLLVIAILYLINLSIFRKASDGLAGKKLRLWITRWM